MELQIYGSIDKGIEDRIITHHRPIHANAYTCRRGLQLEGF